MNMSDYAKQMRVRGKDRTHKITVEIPHTLYRKLVEIKLDTGERQQDIVLRLLERGLKG